MADIKDTDSRSRNMSAIKSRDTKPELFVRKALFADGFRYRIAPKNIPGHPDIYLAKYRLAIFVHGCFWHRHVHCKYAYSPKSRQEFWETKFRNNIQRDIEVRTQLRKQGKRFLIIWECAIKEAQKKTGNAPELIRHIEELICSDVQECEVRANEDFQTGRDNSDCI